MTVRDILKNSKKGISLNYNEFEKMEEQGNSHWWYKARRHLVEKELKLCQRRRNDLKVLELASACGNNFSLTQQYGSYFGIDISWHSIEFCKQKDISTIVQGDANSLPFKAKAFDVILALDVFEHIEDDIVCMKEIRRVIKTDGTLIFNVPANMLLYSKHDRAFHHYRRYTKRQLRERMTKSGLSLNFITYWSFFIFPAVFLMRKILSRNTVQIYEAKSDFHRAIPPLKNFKHSFYQPFLFLLSFRFPFYFPLHQKTPQ